jgi:hypothetical protein
MNVTYCAAKVAQFVGYEDDVDEDPKLAEDMTQWKHEHPEYWVIHEQIEPYGSSGYPLIGTIVFEEVAFGRQFIKYTPESGVKSFTVSNIVNSHRLRVSVLTTVSGDISITIEEPSNDPNQPHADYVVVQ